MLRPQWCLLALSCTAALALDEKPVLIENFDRFDIAALPSGWHKEEAGNLSLINEEGRGKVLKIVNKTGQNSGLEFRLDAKALTGKILDLKFDAKLLKPFEIVDGKKYSGPKIKFHAKAPETKPRFGNYPLKNGDTDWKTFEGRYIIPPGCSALTVGPCIELSASEALFDNLRITILEPNKTRPLPIEDTVRQPPPPPDSATKKPVAPPLDLKLPLIVDSEKKQADIQKLRAHAVKLDEQAAELESKSATLRKESAELTAKADLLESGKRPQNPVAPQDE